MARQPRQRPVSCVFCRTRKLRCNRQYPCSNCTSRGVTCDLGDGAVPPSTTSAGTGLSGDVVLKLMSRLDQLEKTVQSQNEELRKTRYAVFGTDTQGLPARTPQVAVTPQSALDEPTSLHLQRFTADALWLESEGTAEPLTDRFVSDEIEFRRSHIRQITVQGLYSLRTTHASQNGLYPAVKCIWLPLREEARYLTQQYFLEITYFHHIIHMSTLKHKVETLYDDLDAGRPIDKGVALLLLGVLANVCFTWSAEEDSRCSFLDSATANAQATSWVKAGMDVVDHVQRLAFVSMECVQGVTILFFVIFMMEGVSRRGGDMLARAINMARDLGLHSIDRPKVAWARSPVNDMSSLEKEMGRRTMWYLAATDWTLGSLSLPQEGSYLVDPQGLSVRKPANIDDEDLVDGHEIVAKPLDRETSASYFLQRIRLAEMFREVNLLYSPKHEETEADRYNTVLEVDARLHRFLSELPPFFSLNLASTATREFAGTVLRRCTIHLLIRRYLCKIHLPYLARGAVDPAYSYSRRVCLESARITLRSEAQLSKETLTEMSLRTRMTMVLRCVFLASIALVVDACVAVGSHADKARAEEIIEAWATLEQAKKISLTAGRLLELSKLVLRKQDPAHPALKAYARGDERGTQRQPQGRLPATPESGLVTQPEGFPVAGSTPLVPGAPLPLDEQWLGLQGNMDVDDIDWERFFWGVDSAPFI